MDTGPNKAVSTDEMWSGLTDDLKRYVCDNLFYHKGLGINNCLTGLVQMAHDKSLAIDSAPQTAAVSTNEMWQGLTEELKRSVCDIVVHYTDPDVGSCFNRLVKGAHSETLAMNTVTQDAEAGKRKRNDSDVFEQARALGKKPKLSKSITPLQRAEVKFVAPKLSFKWPAFRSSPITFGQPTLSSAVVGGPPVPTPSAPTTISSTESAVPSASRSSPASSATSPFVLFAQANKPAQPPSDCDEQFTFADRGLSPQPHAGAGDAQQQSSAAHNSFGQPPSASSTAPSPSITAPMTHDSAFIGADMSSLKIPADSNASLAMVAYETPSMRQQSVDNSAPRRLKCTQCQRFYHEDQNTALECRRHTGTFHCP